MSAAEQLADNEREAVRAFLEASLATHKAEQDADLDEMARSGQPFRTRADEAPAQTEIPAHVPPPYSQIEFSTKSGALPPKEAPEPSEAPSAKAARARQMLADGFQINAEMTEAIRADDQFAEARADAVVAEHRAIREAINATAPALVEATNQAVDDAEAYLASRASLAAIRERYESIKARARATNFPAADVPVIDRISVIGASGSDAGYRVRKVIQALGQLCGW